MKSFSVILFALLTIYMQGQNISNYKFKVGFAYSLFNDDSIFQNPINIYGEYRFKKWDRFFIGTGLRTFYYNSKLIENFSNRFGFNPYVLSSYSVESIKLQLYFGLGYYFDSYKFKLNQNGIVNLPNRDIKTNGLSITPGLNFFDYRNIFLDLYTIILYTSKQNNTTEIKSFLI